MAELTEKEIRSEIRIRKLVIKKLDTAISALDKTSETKRKKKRERLEELMEYKTYNDAHDAYGYGIITEEEFHEIQDMLEGKEREIEKPCEEECAARILRSLLSEMHSDIRAFEFELLPAAEKTRILEEKLEKSRRR